MNRPKRDSTKSVIYYYRDLEKYCDYLESLLSESQVLTGDDAERFAAMIRDGLDKPSEPAPTPKLDQARAAMLKKFGISE